MIILFSTSWNQALLGGSHMAAYRHIQWPRDWPANVFRSVRLMLEIWNTDILLGLLRYPLAKVLLSRWFSFYCLVGYVSSLECFENDALEWFFFSNMSILGYLSFVGGSFAFFSFSPSSWGEDFQVWCVYQRQSRHVHHELGFPVHFIWWGLLGTALVVYHPILHPPPSLSPQVLGDLNK